jgi:putative heme-binding domain-containing protein
MFQLNRKHRLAMLSVACAAMMAISDSQSAIADAPQLVPYNQDRAPNPVKTPDEAARSMTVPPGFKVEVVASEPAIVNPVAMTFDEKGRIWITESLEYPRLSAGPGRDRVKVLEDTDGDGRFEKVTVFAEGLNIPSGIAVGHGGVWVANAPDILFLQDTDGDGKADRTEVVATGFGRKDTHELPNSLTWGPDGRLYGWNGVFNPSRVVSKNGKAYEFTCAIFRIDPRTREFDLFCEGTSNPWGIAIDPEGSFFSSACVIDHLWHLAETGYYIRQGGPYPPHTWPMGSIVSYKHQKAAYCGINYFDSPAYPPEYRGKLYMGNIHANGINVDKIKRNGSTYQAEPDADFLLANDAWFMPVSQKTGPDGSLYVLDWYDRYHCYQDANRDPEGIDRLHGRLYRIRYKETPRRVNFDLSKLDDAGLIDLLKSENSYDRETAQRLLTERQAEQPGLSTGAKLESLVLDEKAPRPGRMHALWVLVGSGPLDPAFHRVLLKHADPTFRAWGVRAAGNQARAKTLTDATIRQTAASLRTDPSPGVRLQVAIATRKLLDEAEVVPHLLEILAKSGDDRLIPHIVWQNLHTLPEERLGTVAEQIGDIVGAGPNQAITTILPRLIARLLAFRSPDSQLLASLLRRLMETKDREAIRDAVDRLTNHLRRAGKGEGKGKPGRLGRDLIEALRPAIDAGRGDDPTRNDLLILTAYCGHAAGLDAARSILKDPLGNDGTRALAFEAISFNEPIETVRPLIGWVLADPSASLSSEARSRIIAALGIRNEPEVASAILEAYPRLAPELKSRAIELLTQRPEWSKELLAKVASKSIPVHAIDVNQVRKLQSIKDPEIARLVKSLWGTVRTERNRQREQVVRQMRGHLASTPGDPKAGEAVFKKICAQCHKIYGEGQEVGPDLTSNGRNDFNQLVSNVFDPSQVIGDAYESTTIATQDGRVLTGLLVEEGADHYLLKLQGGKVETIPRSQVDEMKTVSVSLMPEGLENQMSPQELADLFAFLCLDKHPTDPSAKSLPGSPPIAPAKAGRQ